jgi:hypothetical protein
MQTFTTMFALATAIASANGALRGSTAPKWKSIVRCDAPVSAARLSAATVEGLLIHFWDHFGAAPFFASSSHPSVRCFAFVENASPTIAQSLTLSCI